jgi:hypothetical protein
VYFTSFSFSFSSLSGALRRDLNVAMQRKKLRRNRIVCPSVSTEQATSILLPILLLLIQQHYFVPLWHSLSVMIAQICERKGWMATFSGLQLLLPCCILAQMCRGYSLGEVPQEPSIFGLYCLPRYTLLSYHTIIHIHHNSDNKAVSRIPCM